MNVPAREMHALDDASGMPRVMGILNVTPDSFSDGGRYPTVDLAVRHALEMCEEGATVIDVGGESTRPGAPPIPEDDQISRVLPVIEALRAARPSLLISVDTRSPRVAARALAAGANIINDVSAGRQEGMLELVAATNATLVLMHMQGSPETMQQAPAYDDVVEEVLEFLLARVARARAAGIARANLVIDPGIGFGKTRQHNLALLAALPRFVATGYRVLLGTSRKRFMGAICRETTADQLLGATCATTALGVAAGVRLFRVHDVRANRQAIEVAWAITRATSSP